MEIQEGPDEGWRRGELADLIIPRSIHLSACHFLTEPAHHSPHGGPPAALLAPLCTLLIRGGVCKESRFITGVQTQMSWLCSQVSFSRLSRSWLDNLRNGLSGPVKPRREVEVVRRASKVAKKSSGCRRVIELLPLLTACWGRAGGGTGKGSRRKDTHVFKNSQRSPPSRWQVLCTVC